MANSTVDMMLDGLESDEESSPFETSVIINSVLNALLIPICIAGNVLVLAAVWRNPSLRTPSIILLCSLAVSDLFVGFLVLLCFYALCLFNSSITYSAIYGIVRHHQHQIHAEYERGTKSQDTREKTRCKHIYITFVCFFVIFQRLSL